MGAVRSVLLRGHGLPCTAGDLSLVVSAIPARTDGMAMALSYQSSLGVDSVGSVECLVLPADAAVGCRSWSGSLKRHQS